MVGLSVGRVVGLSMGGTVVIGVGSKDGRNVDGLTLGA